MYRLSYDEILEADAGEWRSRERAAFDRGLELMRRASEEGTRSPEALEAIAYVQKLWGFLIKDLADPANGLPPALKADLVSIGLWSITEADRLLNERVQSFDALIQVTTSIRDGLK